jgi:hypothetical protein
MVGHPVTKDPADPTKYTIPIGWPHECPPADQCGNGVNGEKLTCPPADQCGNGVNGEGIYVGEQCWNGVNGEGVTNSWRGLELLVLVARVFEIVKVLVLHFSVTARFR